MALGYVHAIPACAHTGLTNMMLTETDQIQAFAGLSLRGQMKLVQAGMKGRFTRGQLLDAAARHTGVSYRMKDFDRAVQDLGAKYKVIV